MVKKCFYRVNVVKNFLKMSKNNRDVGYIITQNETKYYLASMLYVV